MPNDAAAYDVATATVEIKRLTVSGRQMSQSMFRQLDEQPLVLGNGSLAGQPWGRVNYHPNRCEVRPGSEFEHWHIVWQDGDELRRASERKVPLFADTIRPVEGQRFITACVHDLAATGAVGYFDGKLPLGKLVSSERHMIVSTGYEFETELTCTQTGNAVANALDTVIHPPSGHPDYATLMARAEETLATRLPDLTAEIAAFGAATDELYEQYRSACDAEQVRRDILRATHASLAELPQLFIA